MNKLKDRFLENQIKNPLWSDYICFANAIRKSDNYSEVTKIFELVDKGDYSRGDKEEILEYLKSRFATP